MTVTAPSKAGRIVAWINRMRPVPAGSYNCPAFTALEPKVTLTFRARANGRVLAGASETDYGYGSFPCNPVTLTVPGRKPRALIGGRFLEHVQRSLGVSLGVGEGTIKGEIYIAGGPGPQSKKPIAGAVSLYLANQPSRHASTPTSSEALPHPESNPGSLSERTAARFARRT